MQLHRAHDEFRAAGVDVVLIGMGSPRHAAWFRGKYAPDLTVLADDERVSYRAAGLKVGGALDLVGPKSIISGVRRAATTGLVQGRPVGNVSQLGGALVVAAGGDELLLHRASDASDAPEPDVLLAALERRS